MKHFLKKTTIMMVLGLTPSALASKAQEQQKHSNPKWIETKAHFQIIPENLKNLEINNTALGLLIKETTKTTGKELKDLLEKNKKTLLSFEIRYDAPVKFKNQPHSQNTEVIQYGLFRALDFSFQSRLLETKPSSVNIKYKLDDPILIEFLVDNKKIMAPPLLTKTIDKKWKKVD